MNENITINPIIQILPAIIIVFIIIFLVRVSRNKNSSQILSSGSKKIKETKCTCQACGNTWYYGKQELWANRAEKMQNFGKELEGAGSDMMCCGGCLPAAFMPRQQTKQVKDLNKCPKCNSSAVKKEEVIHEL